MLKEKLLQMIDVYRNEFAKVSPEAQKQEQLLYSLKAPCQIRFLTSSETKTHLMVITHFVEIPDKTVEVIDLSSDNYIDQIEQFEKNKWPQNLSIGTNTGINPNIAFHAYLVTFGREIRDKKGLFFKKSTFGWRIRLSDTLVIWHPYGNLDELDFTNESIRTIRGFEAAAEQTKKNESKEIPAQITESIPDSINGLGTYFYPPILVGELNPSIRDEIENRIPELLHEKAISGEFDGVNYVISKGGLIGLETNNNEDAERILNVVMGTAILFSFPVHSLKSHEIADLVIDKQTRRVTGQSWFPSTYRMMLFDDFIPKRSTNFPLQKITTKDLETIIEKAKSLTTKVEHLNKIKLLAGAFTHLDNDEFSQSFIMSWTVVEIHIHELWNKKMQLAGVTKKIREDLDRWDFYRVLEVLHLDKLILNDDYYEMKYLNGLRNDIIHDGHEVTSKQSLQCYTLAKMILKTEFGIDQEIKVSDRIFLGE